MKKKNLFLLLSIVSAIIGVAAMTGQSTTASIIQGIAKGFAGVFFILFFIFMLLEKQPTDKSTH
jgi:uncharacterized membrane protein YuzA (DUF378 family)